MNIIEQTLSKLEARAKAGDKDAAIELEKMYGRFEVQLHFLLQAQDKAAGRGAGNGPTTH